MSKAEVEVLLSRCFDGLKLLVIYIDGLHSGDYTMTGAGGVDIEGHTHVLGIGEGATGSTTVVTELREDNMCTWPLTESRVPVAGDGNVVGVCAEIRRAC